MLCYLLWRDNTTLFHQFVWFVCWCKADLLHIWKVLLTYCMCWLFRTAVTCRFWVWWSQMKDFISVWLKTQLAAHRPWLSCCSESQVGKHTHTQLSHGRSLSSICTTCYHHLLSSFLPWHRFLSDLSIFPVTSLISNSLWTVLFIFITLLQQWAVQILLGDKAAAANWLCPII